MTRKDRTEGIYSRREVLDESERRQYCLIQLKDLLSYAYRYSEDVKKRFDRAQFNVEKFKTLSDIKHIPILKKKELIFLQSMGPRLGGLLTKDIGDLKRIFLSPGPIFDPEDRGEDYWGYTEAFYSVGFRPGDAVQNTFNYQLTPAGLMFEEPLRNLGCAVIPAGPTDASTQLDIMQKLRVSGYVGTPSFLMHLAQKAEEKGLNLRKDLFLEVAFVTGERLSEKMRSQMEKKYDLIMRQGYGTADVGCIGYECFHKTGLHIANRCYVEICHPDTGIPLKDGEVGEIVVTATPKTYAVTVTGTGAGDVSENAATATYKTDYTFKLTKADGYNYTVTVTAGGNAVTATATTEGVYTISGADIKGELIITVEKTAIVIPTTTITITGDTDDVQGGLILTAKNGEDTTFKINKKDGYTYTVKAGDTELTVGADGTVTIPGSLLTGAPLTVTVTKTAVNPYSVEVYEYVKLDGQSIWLVVAKSDSVLAYGADTMFTSEKYGGYCWLVISAENADTVKTEAIAAVKAGSGTAAAVVYTGDVNATGKVDVNDAQLVYNIYNTEYASFDALSRAKFLAADVNGDHTVTVLDAAAVVNTVLGK